MTTPSPTVSRATEADLNGILELQADNQIARGGSLAAQLPRDRLEAMLNDMPLIVTRQDNRVTGFLMTTSRTRNADLPIIQAMFNAYAGTADAYVYGPICVGADQRGKGLAQVMFHELCRLEPGREGILFIRRDNEPSLRAHARMGMREVAEFSFNGFDYAVFSYRG